MRLVEELPRSHGPGEVDGEGSDGGGLGASASGGPAATQREPTIDLERLRLIRQMIHNPASLQYTFDELDKLVEEIDTVSGSFRSDSELVWFVFGITISVRRLILRNDGGVLCRPISSAELTPRKASLCGLEHSSKEISFAGTQVGTRTLDAGFVRTSVGVARTTKT